MIWHLIRYLVTFSIPAYYKKIEGKNIGNLKVKGPLIIAMNHPNAFMDPICITWLSYPARTYFIARGDAFKPGLITFLLGQIGIVPIFRLRDGGKEGLLKNDESYKQVNTLLGRKQRITIFAEGLCIQERRLRPLKKGVSRMVFGAYEHLNNPNLIVVPVGVNYSNPSKFRSNLFYNVGEPLKVSDFLDVYKENQAKGNNQFLIALAAKMKPLITHINNPQNDIVVLQLEEIVTKSWLQKLNLPDNLDNRFKVTSKLTDIVNTADEKNSEIILELRKKTDGYFQLLKKNKLRDWLIDPLNKKLISKSNLFSRCLVIIIGFPLHILGYIAAYLPYKFTEKLTKKLVKGNKEFYASIAFGTGSFIFLFNFLILFFVIYHFSETIIVPLISIFVLLICSWFSMIFFFFIKKTKGIGRIVNNPSLYVELDKKRSEIMNTINDLTTF